MRPNDKRTHAFKDNICSSFAVIPTEREERGYGREDEQAVMFGTSTVLIPRFHFFRRPKHTPPHF